MRASVESIWATASSFRHSSWQCPPNSIFGSHRALVMTPQLQQAIKLLQLSNIELAAFVEQELERNPLLERGQPDADTGETQPETQADPPNGGAQRTTTPRMPTTRQRQSGLPARPPLLAMTSRSGPMTPVPCGRDRCPAAASTAMIWPESSKPSPRRHRSMTILARQIYLGDHRTGGAHRCHLPARSARRGRLSDRRPGRGRTPSGLHTRVPGPRRRQGPALRPAGHLRPRPEGMPGAAIGRFEPA